MHLGALVLLTATMSAQPALVRDINPGPAGSLTTSNWNGMAMLDHGRIVVFGADDGRTGTEPWRTDGTAAGTFRLADLNPGLASSYPEGFTAFGNLVFFNAYSSLTGHEPYVTDGTVAGTRLLADLSPGFGNSNPGLWRTFREHILFITNSAGQAQWYRSDGTTAGTVPVPALPAANVRDPVVAANRLFLRTFNSTTHEVWSWDGSAPPVLVHSIQATTGGQPALHIAFRDRLVFSSFDTTVWRHRLWSSDGTPAGTAVIGPDTYNPQTFAVAGDRLFYTDRPASGATLRVTDGTPAGDRMVHWFQSSAVAPVAVGDMVFFIANDGQSSPQQLWVSDGTWTASVGPPGNIKTAVGSRSLVFVASSPSVGSELWITSGRGYSVLTDLNPGPANSLPVAPLLYGAGRLWFWADDGVTGIEPRVLHVGAGARAVGLGCASGSWPALWGTDPVLGGAFALHARSRYATTPGVALLGVPSAAPLVLVPACTIALDLIGPIVSWPFVTDGLGSWSQSGLGVPNSSHLDGLSFAGVVALAQAGGPFSAALSNGVLLTTGR